MQNEELDKKGYWFDELNSLRINAKRKNELNDRKEMKDLVENARRFIMLLQQSAFYVRGPVSRAIIHYYYLVRSGVLAKKRC